MITHKKSYLPSYKLPVMCPTYWTTEGWTPLPYQNHKNKNGKFYKEFNSQNWI